MARIMVVEDEPITAMDLEQMLVATGHEIAGWSDEGEEAVEKARALNPELVLMDVRLHGEMSGIEAAAKIRGDARARGELMPIVFLTAFADEETVDRAASTGPYGYLVKPFTERSVAAAVRIALARAGEERESRDREAFLSLALSSLAEGLVAVDGDGRCRFANARALDLLGVREGELLGERALSVLGFVDDETGERIDPSSALREGRITAHSAKMIGADGSSRPVELSSAPMIGADGAVLGAIVVFSEPGSRDDQREASFSPSLQDELSNPIMYNLGALSVALREIDALRAMRSAARERATSTNPGEDAALARIETLVRSAQDGASRVASVMKELRSSTPIELGPVAIRPAEILELAVGACAAELEGVDVVREIVPTRSVRGSKWRLSRILADELRTALASIRGDGSPVETVVLSTGVDERGWAEARLTLRSRSSGDLSAEGSRSEIDSTSGAELAVFEGPGARSIHLVLPFISAPERARADAHAQRSCVLVVDDEPMIGRVLELSLAPHHDVKAVDSSAAAMDLLAAGEVFDVVLLDLLMPEINGRELHRWIVENRPDLAERTLVMSGAATDAEEADFLESMAERTLEKPFRLDRLLELVADRSAAGSRQVEG